MRLRRCHCALTAQLCSSSQSESPLAPLCDYLGGWRLSIFRRDATRWNSGQRCPQATSASRPWSSFTRKDTGSLESDTCTMRAGRKTSRRLVEQPFPPKHKRCLSCYYCCCYYHHTALGFCLQGTYVNLCRIQTPKYEYFVHGNCFILCIICMFCCSFAKACTSSLDVHCLR